MKKLYILFTFLSIFSMGSAQTITFTDPNFKALLVSANETNTIAKDLSGNYFTVDTNLDGEIQKSEALQLSYLNASNSSVGNFQEISFFDNMVELDCSAANSIGPVFLDLSGLSNIKKLTCRNNDLPLGIASFSNLEEIDLYFCNLSGALDFTGFSFLKNLNVGRTNTTSLDLTGLTTLEDLNIERTQLVSLDVSTLSNLKTFYCQYAPIEAMDFSNLTNLESITCRNSSLASLTVTGCIGLRNLFCNSNQLTALDVSGLTQLEQLRCNSGNITSLNVTGCTSLSLLGCGNNPLVTLTAQNLPTLTTLFCNDAMLETLDLTGTDNITDLECYGNQLTTLDCNHLHQLDILYCENNPLETLYVKNGSIESTLSYGLNETLMYICADAEQIDACQSNLPNAECVVDSECSMLEVAEFWSNNDIVMYPNPVSTDLNLEINQQLNVKAIHVFNILGQTVLDLPITNGFSKVDVSSLKTGNYFIQIETTAANINGRFIKI